MENLALCRRVFQANQTSESLQEAKKEITCLNDQIKSLEAGEKSITRELSIRKTWKEEDDRTIAKLQNENLRAFKTLARLKKENSLLQETANESKVRESSIQRSLQASEERTRSEILMLKLQISELKSRPPVITDQEARDKVFELKQESLQLQNYVDELLEYISNPVGEIPRLDLSTVEKKEQYPTLPSGVRKKDRETRPKPPSKWKRF